VLFTCFRCVPKVRLTQGCKLLSDIGQCPTKFGKCPSKSNFDRTLVRSQKKIVTHFFAVIANSLNLHFAIKFTRHSSILLTVTLCRNGYTYLSRDLYISCDVYVYVRPKLKVIGQMSCQVKYLFAALQSPYLNLNYVYVYFTLKS
jgi:hypothetical protein